MKALSRLLTVTILLFLVPSVDAGVGIVHKWSKPKETLTAGDTMAINITYEDPTTPGEFAAQALIQRDDEIDQDGKLKAGNTICKALKSGSITYNQQSYNNRVNFTWDQDKNNILILIENLTVSDEGFYGVALAQFDVPIGGMEINATKLIVQDGPHITYKPNSTYQFLVGETREIPCNATGNPTPIVTWFKNGGENETGDGGAILKLYLTKNHNCKNYSCQASNDAKTIHVANSTVCANYPPNITLTPKNWTGIEKSEIVTIKCEASGWPQPIITLTYSETGKILKNPYVLDEIQYKHGGEYKCSAKNIVGSDIAIANITVWSMPSKVESTIDKPLRKVKREESVSLKFTSEANPPPEYSLYFNDVLKSTNKDGEWTIVNFNSEHEGVYFCSAFNEYGRTNSREIMLQLDEYCCYMEIIIALAALCMVFLLLFIFLLIMFCRAKKGKDKNGFDVHNDGHDTRQSVQMIETGRSNPEYKSEAADSPLNANGTSNVPEPASEPATTTAPTTGSDDYHL